MDGCVTTLDASSIGSSVRALRERACVRADSDRVEVFLKKSRRLRASRGLEKSTLRIHHATETGMAIRIGSADGLRSAFAATGGESPAALDWAVDAALTAGPWGRVPLLAASEVAMPERLDADANETLPPAEELREWIKEHPFAEWVESGVTVEALSGPGGWLAVRRRARSWALFDPEQPELVARREGRGWGLPERAGPEFLHHIVQKADSGAFFFLPHAGAPLVAALTALLHGEGVAQGEAVGTGWRIQDDPLRPDGLTGGEFDDVGFPATCRVLADGNRTIAALEGPGTYRRPSFRDPPQAGASTLCLEGVPGSADQVGLVVGRCRVIPMDVDSWILELEILGSGGAGAPPVERTVRIEPRRLVRNCVAGLGVGILTAEGVLCPVIRFGQLG